MFTKSRPGVTPALLPPGNESIFFWFLVGSPGDKGIAHPKMKIIIIYSPAAITCLVINILQNISCIQQKKESRFDQLGGE